METTRKTDRKWGEQWNAMRKFAKDIGRPFTWKDYPGPGTGKQIKRNLLHLAQLGELVVVTPAGQGRGRKPSVYQICGS